MSPNTASISAARTWKGRSSTNGDYLFPSNTGRSFAPGSRLQIFLNDRDLFIVPRNPLLQFHGKTTFDPLPNEKITSASVRSLVEYKITYHVQSRKWLISLAIVRQDDIKSLENRRANSDALVRSKCTPETTSWPGIPGVVF